MSIFFMLLQVVVIIMLAPLFDGMARVLRARLQSRRGPSDFFQTYRDIQKLFKRGRTVPECSHWVFRFGPYTLFGAGAALLAVIPISYNAGSLASYASDIFVVLYIGAMLRFIFGAASIDSGNPFAGVGGSREQMLAVFVEPVMMSSLLVVMLLAKTSNLAEIQMLVQNGDIGYQMPAFAVASISFLWAMYVECGRNPYDLAEAEQEIQEGVLGEYAGADFGIAHAGLILKQFAMIGMFLTIFEPWTFENSFLALIVFILKAGIFYVAAVFIDNFGPRYKLLTSFKSNAIVALCVSSVALILYIVGV
ncbi:respiratory chain complex I subunit 1 family protein [Arcobacter arenosus]|uniref:NADH-quinone oxidoreductase subunit H n=1 Tax=Arcobacter arenosus TaxID=2576037 RepID=A0A5R8XXS3_9BACT|nr:NADH-quinone oxidoreductase subunit H [Arcobacter arenosus]TLP35550.1 NADH-quinone oxidoreductase subunit H [Arcobacter arenosus]